MSDGGLGETSVKCVLVAVYGGIAQRIASEGGVRVGLHAGRPCMMDEKTGRQIRNAG